MTFLRLSASSIAQHQSDWLHLPGCDFPKGLSNGMKVPGSLVGGHSGARCLITPENVGDGGMWKVELPWSEEEFLTVADKVGHPFRWATRVARRSRPRSVSRGDGRSGQDCAEIGKHRR